MGNMASRTRPPPKMIGIFRGHHGVVTAIHFTKEIDDAIPVPSLISGSDSGEIFVWNLKTARTYYKIEGHDGKMVLYLCYHKSSLISQGRDGNIHIWKYADDKWNILRSFTSSSYGFCAAVLVPTDISTYLVAPTGDQSSLTFYDYETSKVLNNFIHNSVAENNLESGREMCMCISMFLKETKIFLIMGYDSGYISLWDYESNKEKSRLKSHPEVVLCLDFDSTYKNRGISGSVDDAVQIWKKTDDDQLMPVHRFTVINPGINAVKIRDDGKRVITAGQDGAIRIFSWKGLKPIAVLYYHKQPIFCLQWKNEPLEKNNAIVFASGSKDTNICVSEIQF